MFIPLKLIVIGFDPPPYAVRNSKQPLTLETQGFFAKVFHSSPKSPCSSQIQSSAVTSPPSGGWRSCCLAGEDSSDEPTAGPSQISPLRRCRWPSAAADLPSRRVLFRSRRGRTRSARRPGKKPSHGWCLPPKRKVLKNRTAQNMNKNGMFHGDRDYLRQELCRNSWFYVHFQVNLISNAYTSQFLVKAHKLKSHVLVQ